MFSGQLKEGEVSRIGLAASTLGDLPPDTAETVLDEFSELVSNELTMKDSNDYVYRLSVRAFGEEKAVRLLREPDLQAVFRERLARTDPVALAGILSKEQPQTVATVLNTVELRKPVTCSFISSEIRGRILFSGWRRSIRSALKYSAKFTAS